MRPSRPWKPHSVLLASIAWSLTAVAALAQQTPPNIAVIILDDVGVELFGAYNQNPERLEVVGPLPSEHRVTRNIEALAKQGLLFRNAWSTPRCAPTRATLFSGLYTFRTGVFRNFGEYLDPALPTLATRLRDKPVMPYPARAAIGKWHLSGWDPYYNFANAPTTRGFTSYAGSPRNGPYRGYRWATDPPPDPLPDPPIPETSTEYITEREIDEAIAFVKQPHDGPWLLWLALHTAHAPWGDIETPKLSNRCWSIVDKPRRVRCRQLEVMDAELGALFATLEKRDPGLANTTVFLIGDNGSPEPGHPRPEPPLGAVNRPGKGSLYEGGINVPLIVAGAGVAPNDPETVEETGALVHAVDVFSTVLDLAGVTFPDAFVDGVSFAGVLGGAPGRRGCVYTDGVDWAGSGLAAPRNHDVAIRDARYKLIRRAAVAGVHDYELYDLALDPGESTPLPESGVAFATLRAELSRLDQDPGASPCRPAHASGCGLGPELAPLLGVLLALRGRQRRYSTRRISVVA